MWNYDHDYEKFEIIKLLWAQFTTVEEINRKFDLFSQQLQTGIIIIMNEHLQLNKKQNVLNQYKKALCEYTKENESLKKKVADIMGGECVGWWGYGIVQTYWWCGSLILSDLTWF